MAKLTEPVRYSQSLDARLEDLIASVKAASLEGLVAKKMSSRYEPGIRSGAWQKMRIQTGQEFVIGGYTVGGPTFDALVFGYYEGKQLLYAARTRNGFRQLCAHRCVNPVLVGQFEFLEWTEGNHLRHSRFVALRLDKDPREVVRENHEN